MPDSHSSKSTQQQTDCRRRSERKALPIEMEIETESGTTPAIVRDVSFDTSPEPIAVGIAFLHQGELKSGQRVDCRVLGSTEYLPREFQFEVKWSRRFGTEGFLSGGVIGGFE